MTNKERDKVIRILQWLHDNKFLFRSTEEDVKYATKLAIQELSQESCEDTINRQAVLKTLDDMDNVLDEDRTIENYKELLKECYEVLPPVKLQQKIGHWIKENSVLRCSICDVGVARYDKYTYCPNCGCRMVNSQESEG